MPIQTLGFLPHMNDFRRSLPDKIFRFLHGKSVVTVDDEDIGGRAFVARCDADTFALHPVERRARLLFGGS